MSMGSWFLKINANGNEMIIKSYGLVYDRAFISFPAPSNAFFKSCASYVIGVFLSLNYSFAFYNITVTKFNYGFSSDVFLHGLPQEKSFA